MDLLVTEIKWEKKKKNEGTEKKENAKRTKWNSLYIIQQNGFKYNG